MLKFIGESFWFSTIFPEDRPMEARRKLENLAEQGDVGSMISLGDELRAGRLYQRDLSKSRAWYDYALSQGVCPAALHGLGQLARAAGLPQEAKRHFEAAASKGYGASLNVLAVMCVRAEGGAKCMQEAKRLWDKAAVLGHVWSMRNLARAEIAGLFGWTRRVTGLIRLLLLTPHLLFVVIKNRDDVRLMI